MSKYYHTLDQKLEEKPTVEHVEDLPNGGCLVYCTICEFTYSVLNYDVCPNCGCDIIFPNSDW